MAVSPPELFQIAQAPVRRSISWTADEEKLARAEEIFDGPSEAEMVEQLAAWVRKRERVREDAARLVVMTRAAGVTVVASAAAEDVDFQTLRQRRLRAERRVRSESVSRPASPAAPYVCDRPSPPTPITDGMEGTCRLSHSNPETDTPALASRSQTGTPAR
jgi:hypothetical protein